MTLKGYEVAFPIEVGDWSEGVVEAHDIVKGRVTVLVADGLRWQGGDHQVEIIGSKKSTGW